MRWTYAADGGQQYPVQPGELWTVGPHTVLCGDVEQGAVRVLLDAIGDTPAVGYVDLPYNKGLARGYRTKAGVDGEKGREVDYSHLLLTALRPLTEAGCLMYVETGLGSLAAVEDAALALRVRIPGAWQISYYGDKPALLLALGDSRGALPRLNGVDDALTPGMVIEAHTAPGDVVVDPMMGRGLTAVSAAQRDRVAIGVELHPARVSVTLRKLAELTGEPPVCVYRT